MAAPVVGGTVWQYVQNWVRGGSRIMITQLLRDRTDTDFTDYATSALAFLHKQLLTGGKVPLTAGKMHESYSLQTQTMQPLYPARKRIITLDDPALVQGVITGDPLPPNSALTMEKYSENAARWGYGTSHFPFGGVGNTAPNGSWSEDFLSDMVDFGSQWIADWLSTEAGRFFRPVLWSSKAPARVTEIIGTTVGNAIRVMIRRTLGRGQ